jgi:hypothetical protein
VTIVDENIPSDISCVLTRIITQGDQKRGLSSFLSTEKYSIGFHNWVISIIIKKQMKPWFSHEPLERVGEMLWVLFSKCLVLIPQNSSN